MATNLNKQWNSINKTLRKKVVKAKIPAQDEFDYEYDHQYDGNTPCDAFNKHMNSIDETIEEWYAQELRLN